MRANVSAWIEMKVLRRSLLTVASVTEASSANLLVVIPRSFSSSSRQQWITGAGWPAKSN